jgi:hypothetical protein
MPRPLLITKTFETLQIGITVSLCCAPEKSLVAYLTETCGTFDRAKETTTILLPADPILPDAGTPIDNQAGVDMLCLTNPQPKLPHTKILPRN